MSMDISSFGYMNHYSKEDKQVEEEVDKAEDLENDGVGSIEEEAAEEEIDDMDTEFEEVLDSEEILVDESIEVVSEEDIELVGEKKPLGRPSKLDPGTLKRLETALKLGMSIKKAVTYSGISRSTFYRWQDRYKKIDEACDGDRDSIKNVDDLDLWDFWDTIKKAQVEGEASHLGVITKAANNGIWQASAWFLERSNPEEWGKREKNRLTDGKEEEVITVEIRYSS